MIFPAGERRRRILQLALPIIGGMLSQNVLNLVDTGMVGVLGNEALAAVGMGSFMNFMASAFVTGMAAGVQAMAARWLGAGRQDETAVPLNGGLLLALLVALPLSILFILLAPVVYPLLGHEAAVTTLGISYLQLRLVGMVGLGMNFAFRGYWNAINLSRVYMGTLLVMHLSNIFLNWVLIFGKLGFPELGVSGAAIGTTLATYLGTIVYSVLAMRRARSAGFLRRAPDRSTLLVLVRTSVPAGVQNLFFATGMTVLFWILGRLGTPELAAANVLTNLTLMGILPLIGFGLASATLVGQALGRGETADAERWGWEVGGLAMVTVGVLALPVAVFPEVFLSAFLHHAETLALARLPLRLVACTLWLEGLGAVLLNSHLGAGNSRHVMVVSVSMQWGVFLPVAYLLGPVLGYGLLAIWVANASYRTIQTGIFVRSWRQRGWAKIRV